MYSAMSMYPSHLVHIAPQTHHNDARHFSNQTACELFHLMNGGIQFRHRNDYILHSHSSVNISHTANKHMPPPHSNGKTFYNTSKREYWNSRNQGKSKRLQHGSSAPCLTTVVADESSDSGISRSPTPSRQHNCTKSNSPDERVKLPVELPKEKECAKMLSKPNSQEKIAEAVKNRRLSEIHCEQIDSQTANRVQPQRRNETQKRRMASYNRSPGFFRNRRINGNMMLRIPTPFPASSLFTPYCTAPDRFLLRSHLMQVRHIPEDLTNGSIWDQLSQSIWKKFIVNQQTEETYKKKMALWKYLYVYIKSYFPKYGLYLVGSTMNGFGSQYSDVDMCLLIRYAEVDQRNEAMSYLSNILKLLERCEFVERLELIQAKVPLLKFRDAKQGLQVDLNCNNSVGIRNTHLLYCYGQMDWRVKPLVLIVKLWAQWHNINDAKNMTISSYSLALMVIHFLQCGVSPKVLPCLQTLYSDKFNPDTDIGNIDIHEELDPSFSENKQSLGELLLQFYQYYASFDFMQYAISIRLASVLPVEECRHVRTIKNDPHQWKFLCIEEPFDLTNTARSVYDPEKFELIRGTIIKTAHVLMQSKKLDSIFTLDPK